MADKPRSERPTMIDENVNRVRKVLRSDCQLTSSESLTS